MQYISNTVPISTIGHGYTGVYCTFCSLYEFDLSQEIELSNSTPLAPCISYQFT